MPFDGTEFQVESALTKLLLKARKRLENGWCRRVFVEPGTEHVCLLGSIGLKSFVEPYSGEAQKQAVNLLAAEARRRAPKMTKECCTLRETVAIWNDRAGRNKLTVLSFMDRVIEASRGV